MRILYTEPSLDGKLSALEASSLDDAFECLRELSYWGECRVTHRLWRESGLPVVIKSYAKSRLCSVAQEQVETELHIHASLKHDRVTPLLVAMEDERSVHLVLQWADGGDLRRLLGGSSSGLRNEYIVRDELVRPLLHVLALLELQGVVHRDLKPENVLLHGGKVQLADFGLAVYSMQACMHAQEHVHGIDQQQNAASSHGADTTICSPALSTSDAALSDINASDDSTDLLASSNSSSAHDLASLPTDPHTAVGSRAASFAGLACRTPSSPDLLASAGGTPLYTAPEVLLALFQSRPVQDAVSHKNDVWALGLMALEVLSGSHPLGKCSNLLYSIAYHSAFHVPSYLSKEATHFIGLATHKDPAMRPSASQLLAHEWMQLPSPRHSSLDSAIASMCVGGSLMLAGSLHLQVKGVGSRPSPWTTPKGTPTGTKGAGTCKVAVLRSPLSPCSQPYEPDCWEF